MLKPSQFFLNADVGPSAASAGRSHFPLMQVPVLQSASESQLGAAWQVPSVLSRPDLHSVELAHCSPQSFAPRAAPAFAAPQPGKSGGQSAPPFTSQRGGGSASSNCGGASVTPSAMLNSTGAALLPQLSTVSPWASLARTYTRRVPEFSVALQ